jgi:hypothetical protein
MPADAPRFGRILTRGLLAGMVMFVIGAVFHWLLQIHAPWIADLYAPPVFRPLGGWTLIYMIVHPFWFGLVFAWLFTVLEPGTGSPLAGARFGAVLFLVGALPVYLLCFASIAIPGSIIFCWLLQGITQYALAGAALGRRLDSELRSAGPTNKCHA